MSTDNKNRTKSLVMIIMAMLIYGTVGIFRKYSPMGSALLSFVRGVIGVSFLGIFMLFKKKKLKGLADKKKLVLLACSGAFIGINWVMLFEAYNYTSVATATLCYYMEPVIVFFGSILVFKDRPSLRSYVCAILSLIGMIFVSGIVNADKMQPGEIRGVFLGLGAAVIYGIVVLMNKGLSGIDSYGKTAIQLFFAAICLGIYLIFTKGFVFVDMTPVLWIAPVIMGLLHTGVAYALYFGSMDGLESRTIGILSYIDPVTALILSFLVLNEKLDIYGIIGAILIIGSAIVDTFFDKKS